MSASSNRLPRALYRAGQVRELDRIAIEDCGIEGYALMRRAGAAALEVLLDNWPQARHLLIFSGPGNNGGDGYVLAGLARQQGLNVEIIQLGDHGRQGGDASLARQFASQLPVPVEVFDDRAGNREDSWPRDSTIVVDALLGTGLERPVEGTFATAIERINSLPFPVLALDIPSGLCSDTGRVLGVAIRATATITFIGLKQGLLTADGVDCTGQLFYSDLDVPERVFQGASSPAPSASRIDIHQLSRLFLPRPRSAHKGRYGHVVIIGGDYGYGGAALLAAEAALRSGAGLVSVVSRSVNRTGFLARCPELMFIGTEDPEDSVNRITGLLDRATVIVIGPGLGQSNWSRTLLDTALRLQSERGIPQVLDADALNLLAQHDNHTDSKRENWILTPHPGEAARLLDCSVAEIQADRFAAVRKLQSRWGGVALLKGAGSLVCYSTNTDQQVDLCNEGNPGMASGGMGDVLSGLVGGLAAQGFSLADSLRLGVCVHGESADLAAEEAGQRGLAATDLLAGIRRLVNPGWQVYTSAP